MKTTFTIMTGSLLLLGCGKQEPQPPTSSIGFATGSTREAIVKQLEQINAKILQDSPELLHAEFRTPEMKRPMQVELGFADATLDHVNYLPQ